MSQYWVWVSLLNGVGIAAEHRAAEPISGFSCSWNNKQNFRALMRREKSVGMKLKNLALFTGILKPTKKLSLG